MMMESAGPEGNREEPLLPDLPLLPPGALEVPPLPPGLQEVVWQRTRARVRWHRHRRRLRAALVVALAYAAGLMTSPLWPADDEGLPPAGQPLPRADQRLEAATPPSGLPSLPIPASAAALKARGDQILSRGGDFNAALVCYQEYLELSAPGGRRQVESDDTWLLALLKQR